MQQVYVSITGLRLKGPLATPRFWWHAIASMRQAKAAPGNLKADARTINGVHHTLTVWTDREAMLAYLAAGAHLKAMKAFRSIATGKTLGFTTDRPPDWDQVHALWLEKGREA